MGEALENGNTLHRSNIRMSAMLAVLAFGLAVSSNFNLPFLKAGIDISFISIYLLLNISILAISNAHIRLRIVPPSFRGPLDVFLYLILFVGLSVIFAINVIISIDAYFSKELNNYWAIILLFPAFLQAKNFGALLDDMDRYTTNKNNRVANFSDAFFLFLGITTWGPLLIFGYILWYFLDAAIFNGYVFVKDDVAILFWGMPETWVRLCVLAPLMFGGIAFVQVLKDRAR